MARRGYRARNDGLGSLVAVGTFCLAVLLFVLGVGWWWKALLVGWLVVIPLIAAASEVFGGSADETERSTGSVPADDGDTALDALREQYATGEITEATFERRVERLLETESVEETRERIRERDRNPERTR